MPSRTNTARPALTSGDWIRGYRPRPDAALRLVCFPHAGGSATAYHPWASAFGPDIDVLAVQYPGRQDRHAEPLVHDLQELADLALPAVRDAVEGRPFALFGHSMGAALAFEVTRRLEAQGDGPSLLAVSGRRAPSLPATSGGPVHHLDDDAVVAHLQDLSGTDPRLLEDPDVREMILPVVRADLRAVETHRSAPGTTVDAPVLSLTGADDPWTSVAEARGWSAHTTGDFSLRVFPGGHFYLAEHQAEVVAHLSEELGSRLSARSARL
ncbi:thioesterase II family protein [Streptomyces sp. NPDC091265]|uniref:thioesterase II family protein n=1 Tax=unclassified Streptomyces TaxID=2593676 RepID=UPI00345108C7